MIRSVNHVVVTVSNALILHPAQLVPHLSTILQGSVSPASRRIVCTVAVINAPCALKVHIYKPAQAHVKHVCLAVINASL